jgi:RecA/RadA recombinase
MAMTRGDPLSAQVRERVERAAPERPEWDGSTSVVSTGSTLLDLAISGGRFERGGIPGGILVEIFGPSGCGKTVLLCEIAGGIQRAGGSVMFCDPEGRLNAQFAKLFDFDRAVAEYSMPDTVPGMFEPVRTWEPRSTGMNAVFGDSLAALSTRLELDEEDGDKMGMRRAKEFSEACRKVCRVLAQRNILMVCSNQVRQNPDAGKFAEKYKSPGGEAIPFYASLRLRCHSPQKITVEKDIKGTKHKRVIGVETQIDVYKSSVWKPHHSAQVCIVYDYGVDDVRMNLTYLKQMTRSTTYEVDGNTVGQSLDRAIRTVEDGRLEEALRRQVTEVWRDLEEKFRVERAPKRRV